MKADKTIVTGLLVLFLAGFPVVSAGQSVVTGGKGAAVRPLISGVAVQNLRLKSKLMSREIPYRIILPDTYSTSNEKTFYPVIYLLHGLWGHFDNWTDRTELTVYAKRYNFIIVTPEGDDGWYTDSVATPNHKYESYIIQELIPEIDSKFRTRPDRWHRFIAGLSMGGYGAIKFGLKYPDKFSLVGSFSGALGAATFGDKVPGAIGKTIDAIFGPANSDTRRSNDIFLAVREMTPERKKTLPFIYLDCGTEDFLFQNNREFVELLNQKGISHEYRELPGAHNWEFWDSQVQQFLQVAERHLPVQPN